MRIDWALSEFDIAARDTVALLNGKFLDIWRDSKNLTVQQNDFASVEAFKVAHLSAKPEFPSGAFDLAIVEITRSKEETRDLIARAAALAPFVLVDGQKTDGIESHYKAIRKLAEGVGSYTKAHGRLFWFETVDLSDWRASPKMVDGFETWPGFFSVGEVDRASKGLADVLPNSFSGSVADLGAGWGYLAPAVLKSPKLKQLDLVEAHHGALASAKRNVEDPRVNFIWGDATTFRGTYDAVVMNPPFHKSRADDPELGRKFIRAAGKIVARHGALWMVANKHLPYEGTLAENFGAIEELPAPNGFKIFKASRPLARNRIT